jgi:dihydrofolate synthase/folylpolyglutamate synthase
LVGTYQAKNAAVAITALELLRQKGWNLSDQNPKDGLLLVRWPARFELLAETRSSSRTAGTIRKGSTRWVESLNQHFPNRKITFLIGIMADKDIPHMIGSLRRWRKNSSRHAGQSRALQADVLAGMLSERGLVAISRGSVSEGVKAAIERAGADASSVRWGRSTCWAMSERRST